MRVHVTSAHPLTVANTDRLKAALNKILGKTIVEWSIDTLGLDGNFIFCCKKEHIDDGPQTEYSTSGTPADCVKLAVNQILDRKPDLCVSGINHGSNSSINSFYMVSSSVRCKN